MFSEYRLPILIKFHIKHSSGDFNKDGLKGKNLKFKMVVMFIYDRQKKHLNDFFYLEPLA